MPDRRRGRGPFALHGAEPNWVYALWSGNECLHVGLTSNLDKRLACHRSTKPWWGEVDRIVTDEVLGRELAMLHEAHDIKKFRPRYNTAHNPDRKKDPLAGLVIENRRPRGGA